MDVHSIYENYTYENFSRYQNFNRAHHVLDNDEIYYSLLSVFGLSIFSISLNKSEPKKRFQKLRSKCSLNPLYCVITLILLPFFLIPITFFVILKKIIDLYLKIKHGDLYGGILLSSDSIWVIEDASRTVINVIVIVNGQTTDSESFIKQIKRTLFEKVFSHPVDFAKLTSIRMRVMGFTYLLRNQLSVDDCARVLDIGNDTETISATLLQEIVSKNSNNPLPKQNQALWEVLLFPRPVEWIGKDRTSRHFAILLRFSHVVGDGLSLTNLLSKTFADSGIIPHPKQSMALSTPITEFRNFIKMLYTVLITPSVLLYQNFLRKEDENILHVQQLSGEKMLVYAVEDGEKFVGMVKRIKSALPGITFSDIILSSISSSLECFFLRKHAAIPKFVTAALPALGCAPGWDSKPILQNQFSIALLDLPVSTGSKLMTEKLRSVKKYTDILREAPDYQVNHLLLTKMCGLIPYPILQKFLKTDKLTMSISNVPGVPRVSILNGYEIADVVFFTPHRGTAGLGFSILTYDNRFQLGLTVDKAVLSSKDDALSIIENVFEQISLLNDEILKVNLSTKCEGDKVKRKVII